MPLLIQCLVLVALGILYSISTVIYRLLFHPLARFPGPKLAAATKWYELWFDLIKHPGGTFMYEIERMHDVYGTVRLLVCVLERDADDGGIQDQFAQRGFDNCYTNSSWALLIKKAVFGTIAHETHRQRRAALNPLFSKAATASSETTIYEKLDMLSQYLTTKFENDGVVEIRQIYLALATDILSEYAFDKPTNLLADEKAAGDWTKTMKAVAALTPLIKQFPWLTSVAPRIPLGLLRVMAPDLARIETMRLDLYKQTGVAIHNNRLDGSTKEGDGKGLSTGSVPTQPKNIFQTILSSKYISKAEKEQDRIAQEAFGLVGAGGETVARVLVRATYHLIANRDTALLRLKKELATLPKDLNLRVDLKTLEKMPWLTAVVKESLRIAAVVSSRLPVVSPKDPLIYGEWEIPAGTPVSMTLRDALLDPAIFPNPMDFMPERWLSENPDLHRLNQAYVPFSRGSRMCLGLK
ncbi:MAG: hypothetical protein Q9169_004676 [Polycauliona sp. 2 TL-2023]